jgi:glycosyltransferase involved in cell wall biosynthesis
MPIMDTNQPFFSVIIPTYNRAKHLVNALTSILQQEFLDFEVIIVDDGSTDDTKILVSEIANRNSQIKYFYKENEERSIARNYGIMKAMGRYIGFLDSDDILYPNHLRVGYELLRKNNFPEVGHLGYQLIDTSGHTTLTRNTFDASFKDKLIGENIIHGNAIFIRRDIATEVHFIPDKAAILSEDWYLWLRLAARYPFYFDNTITSAIVVHEGRSLSNINPDKLIASTNIIVQYLQKDKTFLAAYRGRTSYHFANHYTFLTLILALTKKRRSDTLRFLLKSIRYDPTVVWRKRFLASIKHLL